jgi:hypothetical protein
MTRGVNPRQEQIPMQSTREAAARAASIAERVTKRGLRLVKARAKRDDRIGEATYRALDLASDGLGIAAKALRELGDAIEPPARTPRTRPSPKTAKAGRGAARARSAAPGETT